SHRIMAKLVWLGQRPFLNEAWKRVYGHSLPFNDPIHAAFKKTPPLMFYAYSKHILPKPVDWSEVQCVTGYWFLKAKQEWKPSAELEQFLASGSKPVYIGFGSMNDGRNKSGSIKTLILETVKRTGQRAVLLNAGLGLVQSELPENIFVTEPVPFEYLFPKMAAVVHHGGAGTTAAALRAGVPSVITPLIYDQRFWSWCVENIGAGTTPIAWNKVTVDNLTAGINTALANDDIKNRALQTSERMREENGIEKTIELFNSYYC
ncbi:glycosyltransferase, partial [uncultured Mucilaginibacter sp.]|uniref:glycosyltransferase n=1 Tax=uncultured Mucilaginibacter sp. TaxID=797541 RepID=UPI0025CC68D4